MPSAISRAGRSGRGRLVCCPRLRIKVQYFQLERTGRRGTRPNRLPSPTAGSLTYILPRPHALSCWPSPLAPRPHALAPRSTPLAPGRHRSRLRGLSTHSASSPRHLLGLDRGGTCSRLRRHRSRLRGLGAHKRFASESAGFYGASPRRHAVASRPPPLACPARARSSVRPSPLHYQLRPPRVSLPRRASYGSSRRASGSANPPCRSLCFVRPSPT